jgi:1-acyl-sn-glycerol-3-phosphate acyltransferase
MIHPYNLMSSAEVESTMTAEEALPSTKNLAVGSDGMVDQHGDPLPELGARAASVDLDKIISSARRKFSGEHPGSQFFWKVAKWTVTRSFAFQFRSIEVTGEVSTKKDQGTMFVAWHTNGLIDPLVIVLTQPKRFIFGGRHDLITRPVVGWWSRRLGVQPVIRQAELMRGGCTKEEARNLNGQSLLVIANCISSGIPGVLMPEGTSHQQSHLLRLRTGPMRTVIAAAGLAHARGLPLPTIQPVGLHFRVCHRFRTDMWVEYGDPLAVSSDSPSAVDLERMQAGEWIEPGRDAVNSLRDEIRDPLRRLTPDAPDWDTWGAWQITAHLRASSRGSQLNSWRSEVIAAREVRTDLSRLKDADDPDRLRSAARMMGHAKSVHRRLWRQGLDARDITAKGRLKQRTAVERILWLPALVLASISFPLSLLASGLPALLGFVLGNRTDEGLDARASVQLMLTIFTPVIFWPICATLLIMTALTLFFTGVLPLSLTSELDLSWFEWTLVSVVGWLSLFPLFWVCSVLSLWAYDFWMAYRRGVWRSRLAASTGGLKLAAECRRIIELIDSGVLTDDAR